MGMQTSNKAAATFDSTYGWLMTASTSDSDYDNNFYDSNEQDVEALKYTKNGRSFGELPALNYTRVGCLETLDNGGDIFAITTSNDGSDRSGDIFIFNGNTSTWEHKIGNITFDYYWWKIAGMHLTKQ